MGDRDWYIGGASTDGSHVDIKGHGLPNAVCNGVPVRAAGVVVEEHNAEVARLNAEIRRLKDVAGSYAQALQWYADEAHYNDEHAPVSRDSLGEVFDLGKRARNALGRE